MEESTCASTRDACMLTNRTVTRKTVARRQQADGTTEKYLTPVGQRVVQTVLNLLLLSAWLWLYAPLFDYFTLIFAREDFRTNQIVLLAALLLIGLQLRSGDLRWSLHVAPRPRPLPLGVMLGGSLLYLACERFLAINTLSATCFGLASYGLLGLWLPPARWRQGLPAALLLIGALPFGEHMQTFVGYPMRLATAALVRDGLAAAGIGSVGIDTILIFENGVSQIDMPCSGVKSLWTGTLFLLAATWIERRCLDLYWFGVAALLMALLFFANVVRVAVLMTAGPVLGWTLLAEMVHVPLGVLGFVIACGAAALLLRRQRPFAEAVQHEESTSLHLTHGRLFGVALLLATSGMALLYTPHAQNGLTQATLDWSFPAALTMEPQPLTANEHFWLMRDGAESAQRWRFTWHGSTEPTEAPLRGTLMVVVSETWRAHHRPERCFEVHGLALDNSYAHLVTQDTEIDGVADGVADGATNMAAGSTVDFPVRIAQLSDGAQQWTASYWFQSAAHTTDDYTARIWDDLRLRPQRWVLVTMVFDDAPDLTSTQHFYSALHQSVARALDGETP